MYGEVSAYKKQDEQVALISRGNHELHLHRDKGMLWCRARIQFGNGTKIDEFLVCEDEKRGIFRLTSRVSDAKVPITTVTRRELYYHCNQLIRMKIT